ncbi:UNVERIFIED_CONTAM: Cytochrome P450 4C1 [Trichonephila clavipes]
MISDPAARHFFSRGKGYETVSMSATWALFLIGHHAVVQKKIHEELDKVFAKDNDIYATEEDLNQLIYLNSVLMVATPYQKGRLVSSLHIFCTKMKMCSRILKRKSFAWMELKTIMSYILRNYTVESLDSRDEIIPEMRIDLTPSKDIRLRIRPRKLSNF